MNNRVIQNAIYAKEMHRLVLMALCVLAQRRVAPEKEQYAAARKQCAVMEQCVLAHRQYVMEKKQSVPGNMRDALMAQSAERKISAKIKGAYVMRPARYAQMALNVLARLLCVAARGQYVPALDQNVMMEPFVGAQALFV
jgi:hypothetical protein